MQYTEHEAASFIQKQIIKTVRGIEVVQAKKFADYSLSPAAWFLLNDFIYEYLCIAGLFMREYGTVYA